MKFARLSALALLLALSTPSAAQSDWQEWPMGDRWRIGLGYFAPDLDTQVIVADREGNIGTGISFERNLGLDDSEGTFMLEVGWRFAKRHVLEYNYFELERSATTTQSSVTIKVGDEFFDLTLPIQSFFDIVAHEISYSYSLLFDEKKDLYLGIGISLQDLSLGLQGTESSPNPGEVINSKLDSTAPLPTLNVGFDYAFSDKWIFQSKLGWLAVEADFEADEDLSGQVINANAGILWKPFNNVGFFAQYQVMDVDVDYTVDIAIFSVDYDYMGPVLGVYAAF